MEAGVSQLCPHGFAPSECLICRTLGTQPQVQVEAQRAPAPQGSGQTAGMPGARQDPARPDVVYSPDSQRGHSLASYALLGVLAIVAVIVAGWIVAGVLIGLLHALELLAVAAAAGWVGYRIGHYRGRRAKS
jgi:hypothetical protein